MRRLPPNLLHLHLHFHPKHLPPPPPPPPLAAAAATITNPQIRTFRQPKTSQNSTITSKSKSLLPRISRTTTPPAAPPLRRQKPGTTNTILRFKITLAPPGVSKKVLELVKRASASKHLLRGTASVISLLSTLPSPAGDEVGPVVFALSGGGGSVVEHVPVILECNRLGIPWVYVPASSPAEGGEEEVVGGRGGWGGGRGEKGVVGRTGVGTVMVVPWVASSRGARGEEVMPAGEGSRAVAKEFNFRDARRVVVGLLAEAWDLDSDCGEEEGGE
ncbi:hypothetical protein B9Z19DRAFT_1131228 [Tuber borchii]|uniref:Uncharacterized protein n=1 Tax=Tuber borchii TaxID=42251 RepID=A0A2T6ZJ30_TUBBO|nr:hypothetical protein B9Z19DRAFT_1131228 [Tuber borchii]